MHEYKAEIDRVVDGDTVDVSIDLGFDIWYKARVRLAGIDAWESRTKDLEEKEKGLAAKARLKELVDGKEVILRTSKDSKGKFGRVLADVILPEDQTNPIIMIGPGTGVAPFLSFIQERKHLKSSGKN